MSNFKARLAGIEKQLGVRRPRVLKGYTVVSPDDWDEGGRVDNRPAAAKGYRVVSEEEGAIHDEHE